MACNIAALTSGNIKLFKNTEESIDKMEEDILGKIRRLTYDLSRTDCGDTVYDYFNRRSNGALDTVNKKVTQYADIGQWMTKLSDFVRTKSGTGSPELVDTLCLTVNGFYKTLLALIEDTLKIIPSAFKKLDELRREIEQVILNFGLEIKNCIIDVLSDVQRKLNALTSFSLDIDFATLQKLMEGCPCIIDMVKGLFGCHSATSAYEVITCIRDIFNLTPSDALRAINDFFNNTLKATVQTVFNALEQGIRYAFKVIMAPIREFVKWYCSLLNFKFDVSIIISTLGPADCLLLYSNEVKTVAGKTITFKGMSVIDIINTFKMWGKCFDTVCSFSDDLNRDIKKFNEDLRLNSKYWKDPYTVDIFTSCMAFSAGINVDQTETREIFVRNQDSGKNGFLDLYNNVKKLNKNKTIVMRPYTDIGLSERSLMKPEPDSSIGNSTGNLTGTKVFHDGVQDDIESLISTLSDGLSNESYYRMLISLETWAYGYKQDVSLIDAFDKAQQEYINSQKLGNTAGNSVTSINQLNSTDVFNADLAASYKIVNDYTVVRFDNKPERVKNSSLLDYYKEWYSKNAL